jgi:hypothetical protein
MSFRAIAARASRSPETKELAYARVFCLMKRRIAFMYNFEQEHAYVHALSASAKKECGNQYAQYARSVFL